MSTFKRVTGYQCPECGHVADLDRSPLPARRHRWNNANDAEAAEVCREAARQNIPERRALAGHFDIDVRFADRVLRKLRDDGLIPEAGDHE